MTSESTPPPPTSGGSKYALIGLALILGAAIIWFLTRKSSAPEQKPTVTQDAGAGRSTAMVDDEVFIPEPEVDAGPPVDAGVQKKIVYKYVSDNFDCSGEVPAAKAREVIGSQQKQVRSCYERRLKANHTLQGNVRVDLKIGASGQVAGVRIGGTLRDPEVFSCIRQLAMSWHFPNPSGGTCAVVSAPFNMTPRSQ